MEQVYCDVCGLLKFSYYKTDDEVRVESSTVNCNCGD